MHNISNMSDLHILYEDLLSEELSLDELFEYLLQAESETAEAQNV